MEQKIKLCIGCDQPAPTGMCENCEKNLIALGNAMDEAGLKFTDITFEATTSRLNDAFVRV
jgi:hypothetical protein